MAAFTHFCGWPATCSRFVTLNTPGTAVGANARRILVRLAVDDSVQRDVAVLHRDTDGLRGINRVLVQRGESVNSAIDGSAYPVIHG